MKNKNNLGYWIIAIVFIVILLSMLYCMIKINTKNNIMASQQFNNWYNVTKPELGKVYELKINDDVYFYYRLHGTILWTGMEAGFYVEF